MLHLLLWRFAGGDGGPSTDTIDFVTIATTGNARILVICCSKRDAGGASSSTRGVFMGGTLDPEMLM